MYMSFYYYFFTHYNSSAVKIQKVVVKSFQFLTMFFPICIRTMDKLYRLTLFSLLSLTGLGHIIVLGFTRIKKNCITVTPITAPVKTTSIRSRWTLTTAYISLNPPPPPFQLQRQLHTVCRIRSINQKKKKSNLWCYLQSLDHYWISLI